ncbi:MAG: hypothetical protein IKY10_01370, partial [Clostridia bacterium]|nr:hypothetical protein [Clostridia bacterium]
ISPKECEAWRNERHFNINQIIVKMLEQGKRIPKAGAKLVSEKSILKSRIAAKSDVLSLEQKFAPEFKAYAGKKADTAKIFAKVIGRNKKQEDILAM